jgi:hypothetical protein
MLHEHSMDASDNFDSQPIRDSRPLNTSGLATCQPSAQGNHWHLDQTIENHGNDERE